MRLAIRERASSVSNELRGEVFDRFRHKVNGHVFNGILNGRWIADQVSDCSRSRSG